MDSMDVGYFFNGKMNGKGFRIIKSGDLYVGGFKDDYMNGIGSYIWDGDWKKGGKFDGEFNENRFLKGTKTWKDGTRYHGEFKNYAPDGKGTYEWVSGVRYEGGFKSGRCHGDGVVTWLTDYTYAGGFDYGIPKDKISCLHPQIKTCVDNQKCTGQLTKAQPQQYGQFFFTCLTCTDRKEYCASCIKTCHSSAHEWKTQWACSIFNCQCFDSKQHD